MCDTVRRTAVHHVALTGAHALYGADWRSAMHLVVWQARCHALCDAGRRTAMHSVAPAGALPRALWRWQAHCRVLCSADRRTAARCVALTGVCHALAVRC